jgi:hypothetical protein
VIEPYTENLILQFRVGTSLNYATAITRRRIAKQYSTTIAKLNALQAPAYDDCRSCAQTNASTIPHTFSHRHCLASTSQPRQRQIPEPIHYCTTRYLLTVPLATKSAATIAIHHDIARLQLNTGRVVRLYYANNAREQHAEPLRTFFLSHGAEMTSTTLHKSQQNVQAERARRIIFSAERSAIAHSKLGN